MAIMQEREVEANVRSNFFKFWNGIYFYLRIKKTI